jgi:DNA-binding NarL/FixJ family response regulator
MTYVDGILTIAVSDEDGFDLAAADTSTSSSKFGLYSIRERMKALGGKFEIISARGGGTFATLLLPIDSMRHREEQSATDELLGNADGQLSAVNTSSDRVSNMNRDETVRILLVDDHAVLRQGLRSIVTGYEGFEVVGEAADGMEAVELAQRLRPDVVIMDINMPKMNGIEATKRIKAKQPEIVVIGLSVHQSSNTAEAMRAAGASGYLTKENAAEVLCQAIDTATKERNWLENSHFIASAAEATTLHHKSVAPAEKASLAGTVLFIDGNAQERKYFANQLKLRSPDYHILEAGDGREGLDVYRRDAGRIDCVVLDLTLPDMSSFEVLLKLIPRVRVPEVAVVVLTAVTFESLLDLARRNGAQECLIKSQTSGEQLDMVIRKAVNRLGPRRKERP